MKHLILSLATLASIPAYAVKCDTDADCLSASIILIKKAAKLGACKGESEALARTITRVAQPGSTELQALEECVDTAKYAAKVDKRSKKRLERIKKALETPRNPGSLQGDVEGDDGMLAPPTPGFDATEGPWVQ